jgi:D-aspartate ligase
VNAAVVLQASGPNALGIVRSLGRMGVEVIATDHDSTALAMSSRYARGAVIPDPLADPDAFIDGLLVLGRRHRERPVLFATHDEALAAIGPREAEIDEVFLRPWNDWAQMQITMDKSGQHAAARRIGFPIPATVVPGTDDDPVGAAAAAGLRYPVILKPEYSPEFRRVFRAQVLEADGPGALREAWGRAARYGPQIQEVIPGDDDQFWTLGSYRDRTGRPVASFTGRKLRQWPPHFGTARAAEARWDPALAERCHHLLDALDFHGISQVEVKRDARDGRDYLIEVNPRSWLWISLATACGVNIPYACYRDAIGSPIAFPSGHRGGKRWTLITRHAVATAREVRRRRWGVGPAMASLRPPIIDAVIDPRDPRPSIQHLTRMVRRRG